MFDFEILRSSARRKLRRRLDQRWRLPVGWLLLYSLLVTPTLAARPSPIALPGDEPLESFVITEWSLGDGLPDATLNDILRPEGDYLWIATYSGLLRFDGQRFVAMDPELFPDLRANGFLCLYELDGKLVIGTQADGLLILEEGRFVRLGEQLPQAHEVSDVLRDSRGRLWIGATDSGVYRYQDGKPVPVDGPGLTGRTVQQILEDHQGAFWFATEGAGLVRLEGETYTTYTTADALPSNRITSLLQTPDRTLWVGTSEGLARFDEEGIETFPELGRIRINLMQGDRSGNLWIASQKGLLRWSPVSRRVELLAEYRGRSLRNITGIMATPGGNVWFCTYAGALFQIRSSRFDNFTRADALASEKIGAIGELDPQTRLIGTDNGKIHRIVEDEVSTFELKDPLPDVQIRDIYRDDNGRLWIASDIGLTGIVDGEQILYTDREGLPDTQARLTRQDRRGDLWIGTGGGVARLKADGELERLEGDSELTSHLVLSIAEDAAGNLWVGTRGGLLKRSPEGELTDFLAARDLPGSLVFSTYSDSDGATWACTNRGLVRILGNEITTLSTAQGLPIDSVFDYLEDSRGFVWLSSTIGLIRISKRELVAFMDGELETVEPLVLDERDGMVNASCTGARKMFLASDGRLWIPTLGGVSVLDPGALELNTLPPSVVLNKVSVLGASSDGLSLDSAALETEGVRSFPPGAKRFAFDFSVLSFEIPSKVRARYRLEGFDIEWIEAGKERSIQYTALPAGSYTFRVIAANNDGVWNREGISFRFDVEPFFYRTPLFFLLVLVGLSLIAIGLHRWRIRIFERAERKLRESERRLRLLFTKASDAILIISSGRVVDCNARACEIFGYPCDDLIGRRIVELCPSDDRARGNEAESRSLADAVAELEATGHQDDPPDPPRLTIPETDADGEGRGGPVSDEHESPVAQFRQLRRDGSAFDSEVSLVALRSKDKLLVQAIIRDVSERVRLIEELGARSLELERFIYTVSHDLKSPLYTIHGFLGLLGRDIEQGNASRIDEDMDRIRAAVTRMGQLLDELLELSRIGRLDNEPQEIPLTELAREAITLVEGRIASRRVKIDIAPDLPTVFGDRPRLLAVFQNLIDNAAKFMDEKPAARIEIATRQDAGETVIFVRDNGTGFDPRYREKVFGLFEQLNPGREGTGIGLAIVKRIIEVHGGRIWAESDGLGKGSTFCFTLAAERIADRPPVEPAS